VLDDLAADRWHEEAPVLAGIAGHPSRAGDEVESSATLHPIPILIWMPLSF
jgi:hypothetical protein